MIFKCEVLLMKFIVLIFVVVSGNIWGTFSTSNWWVL